MKPGDEQFLKEPSPQSAAIVQVLRTSPPLPVKKVRDLPSEADPTINDDQLELALTKNNQL
jgi:hypothetical protein